MTIHYRHRRTANPATAFPATIQPGEIAVNTATRQLVVGDAATGQPLDLLGVRPFATTSTYATGNIVSHLGSIYRARGAVAAGAFDPTKWDMLDTAIPWFNAGATYAVDDLVRRGTEVYRARVAVSAGAWNATQWAFSWGDVRSIGTPGVELVINMSKTGVADPVNPLGGDPFDSLKSIIAWTGKYEFKCQRLVVNIAAGTYEMVEPIVFNQRIGCELLLRGAALAGAMPLKIPNINWSNPDNPVAPARGPDELYATACARKITQTYTTELATDVANNKTLCLGTYAAGTGYTGGRLKTIFRFAATVQQGFISSLTVGTAIGTDYHTGTTGVVLENLGVEMLSAATTSKAVVLEDMSNHVYTYNVAVFCKGVGISINRCSNVLLENTLICGANIGFLIEHSTVDTNNLTIYGSLGEIDVRLSTLRWNNSVLCCINYVYFECSPQVWFIDTVWTRIETLWAFSSTTTFYNNVFKGGGYASNFIVCEFCHGVSFYSPMFHGVHTQLMRGSNSDIHIEANTTAAPWVVRQSASAANLNIIDLTGSRMYLNGTSVANPIQFISNNATGKCLGVVNGSSLIAWNATLQFTGVNTTVFAHSNSHISLIQHASATYSPAFNSVGNANSSIMQIL